MPLLAEKCSRKLTCVASFLVVEPEGNIKPLLGIPMAKKKSKRKEVRTIINRRRLSMAFIATLMIASLVTNIVQAVSYIDLRTEVSSVSSSLANYRELQSTQIKAVREACSVLKEDVNNSESDRNLVRSGLALLSSSIASAYMVTVLQTCYAPLYSVSGVLFMDDIDAANMDDLVLEPNSNFDIREDAFDNVRW